MSVVGCHLHGPSLLTREFVPSPLIVVAFGIALPAAETAIAASFVALFIESHSQWRKANILQIYRIFSQLKIRFRVRSASTLMGDWWGSNDNDLLTHIYGSFYSTAFVGGIAWRSSCIQLHLFTLCRVSWNFAVPTFENTYNYKYKYESRNNNRSTSKVTSIIH